MGKKTALVTGACGFTGTHMIEQLVENDWDVVGTDLEAVHRDQYYTEEGVASPSHYHDVIDSHDVEFIAADITDRDSLQPVFAAAEYDAVFHVASLFDYFADRETLDKVNVEGARNVAELAAEHEVGHFVHWSTLGVLGHAGFDKPKEEDDAYHPHNRYCASKMVQEQTLHEISEEEGLPLTVLRPGPIYGPRHRYGVYHILLVLSKLGYVPQLRVYPRSREPRFPSIHVTDLCRAAVFLHEHKEESVGETYNVTHDCVPQHELLGFLGEAIGLETKPVPLPYHGYKGVAKFMQWWMKRLERKAREQGIRPKVDASMAEYVTRNMWFSNQKLRGTGFEFMYEDTRKGLWEYVAWCKEEGLIPSCH